MRGIILFPTFFLFFIFSYSFASNIEVEKFVCSEFIENREPIGISDTFPSTIEKIFCFSKVRAKDVPTYIYHVWYKNNKKVFEIKLNVNYHTYRTWSYKNISKSDIGDWKVELLDSNKTKIAEVNFQVVSPEEKKENLNEKNSENNISTPIESNLTKSNLISQRKLLEENEKKDISQNLEVKKTVSKDLEKTNSSFQNNKNIDKENVDSFITKSFYLILLIIFYVVFFPTVYLLHKKAQSK